MTMACNGQDLTPLGQSLLERAHRDGWTDPGLLMDVSIILQLKGNPNLALAMQQQALSERQLYRIPAQREPAIRLLALKSPGLLSANTPLEFLFQDSDIDLTMLYVSPDLPVPETLPEHDVLFVAVGYSEKHLATLRFIEQYVARWPRPVLNLPNRISTLSRDMASNLLQSVPGVVVPVTTRVDRTTLESFKPEFPIIIRPVDSHAGIGLAKTDNAKSLSQYLAQTPDTEFYVAPFVDYRSKDRQFRKYRVVLIDGRPYAGHMAISDHWVIHYLNGGMEASPAKRLEEEQFFANFDDDFARRHGEALRCIGRRVGLDYLVMDCAETRDGQLLVFEVDNNAVVHAMDPVETFPYKKPQLRKIAAAFREMLIKSANEKK
jgi:glutathione synthase/RimK-type ligase-like ATP-grasp enzyme